MSDKLSREDKIKILDEIWRFYEADKQSLIRFFRSGYPYPDSEDRIKEADEIYEELKFREQVIEQIKSLLTPIPEKPKMESEPGGLKPGEYMHEWMEQDAVELDLPTEEIIGALCRDNKLLKDKLDKCSKPVPEDKLKELIDKWNDLWEQRCVIYQKPDMQMFLKEFSEAYEAMKGGGE